MGFVVLMAVGTVLGWIASILARADHGRGILQNVLAGLAGSLVGGVLTSNESLLVGLSPIALLASVAGALVFLAGFNFAQARAAG